MVRRMFEEYKFFPGFPEKELRITGQLFGGIIDQGLVPLVTEIICVCWIVNNTSAVMLLRLHSW